MFDFVTILVLWLAELTAQQSLERASTSLSFTPESRLLQSSHKAASATCFAGQVGWEACESSTQKCTSGCTRADQPPKDAMTTSVMSVLELCPYPKKTATVYFTTFSTIYYTTSTDFSCTSCRTTTVTDTSTIAVLITTTYTTTYTLENSQIKRDVLALTPTPTSLGGSSRCEEWATTITSTTTKYVTPINLETGIVITVHTAVSYFVTNTVVAITTEYVAPPERRTSAAPGSKQSGFSLEKTTESEILAPSVPASNIQPAPPAEVTSTHTQTHKHTLQDSSFPSVTVNNGHTIPVRPAAPSISIRPAVSGQGIVLPDGHILLPGSSTTIGTFLIDLPTSSPSSPLINGQPFELSSGGKLVPSLTNQKFGITLPDGQKMLPGTSMTYQGHTISLSASGTGLKIDGEVVDEFHQIQSLSRSDRATTVWAVKLPGSDEYILIAPETWQAVHDASLILDHNKMMVVVDGMSSLLLDTASFTTALPTAMGVGDVFAFPAFETSVGSSTIMAGPSSQDESHLVATIIRTGKGEGSKIDLGTPTVITSSKTSTGTLARLRGMKLPALFWILASYVVSQLWS